jgi:twinkle protein
MSLCISEHDRIMSTPQEVNLALSGQIDAVMQKYFPDAKKRGNNYEMGDLDGNKGSSCGVFRAKGGVYLAKDSATGECIPILSLIARKHLNWKEAFVEARRICGLHDLKPAIVVERPAVVKDSSTALGPMRGTEAMKYLSQDRGLSEAVLQKYGIRSHKRYSTVNEDFWAARFHDADGNYVMLKSTGVLRNNGKKDIWSTKAWHTLWGWDNVQDNDRSILIAEGEIDAMSWDQMDVGMPCLSVPSGVSNLGWIDNDYEALSRFENIYISMDNDEAGQRAAKEIAKRLGLQRCRTVQYPSDVNDANDLLRKHPADAPALVKAAESNDPPTLRTAASLGADVADEIHRYESEKAHNPFMWPELPFRLREGELVTLGGYAGHGKSQLMYQMLLHEMAANGRRGCIASFEIPSSSMLMQMLWMQNGKCPDPDKIEDEVSILADKLWFVESEEGVDNSWESIKDDFLYANRRYGCDIFVIDALMHLTAKDDWNGQARIAKQAAKFALDNRVTVILIAHCDAKKASSSMMPENEHVLGGQEIVASSHSVVLVWRNVDKEKRLEAGEQVDGPDGKFYVSKQRNSGVLVYRDLWYQKSRRMFHTEIQNLEKLEKDEKMSDWDLTEPESMAF